MRRKESDLRVFIRDQMARFDKRTEAWERAMTAELRSQREESRRYWAQQDAKLEQILEEGRTGRAAIWAILDKLNDRGDTPPETA